MKKATLVLAICIMCIFTSQAIATPGPHMIETIYEDWEFKSGITYGWSGDGHVYDYASYIDFYWGCFPDDWVSGIWIGTSDLFPSQLSWGHTIPDLVVPPDEVLRAKLYIDGSFINQNSNTIQIEGTWEWDPLNKKFLDNTNYNLTDVDEPGFWNDGMINSTVYANEWGLSIDRAVLMMDYNTVVPEPATLLFVGMGILGAGIIRRFKK